MQYNDFNKSLELFMRETNNSISKLGRQIKSNFFNQIVFESCFSNAKHYFKALNSGQGYVEITFSNRENTFSTIYLNGTKLYSGLVESTKVFYCGFYVGENVIDVTTLGGEYLIKVYGNVEVLDVNSSISLAPINNGNVIMFFDGKRLKACIENNGVISDKSFIDNVIQGAIVGVKENDVYVSYIDVNSNAYLVSFNKNTLLFSTPKNLNYKANSVGGYMVNDKFIIYASRLNYVYKAEFFIDETPNFISINVTGKKLYIDYNESSAFITLDNVNTAKLVTINLEKYFQYTIPRGSNYHLYKINEGYLITYFDGVCYRSFTFINGKISSDTTLCYARESITIQNTTLIYLNNGLKVIKE